MKRWVQIILVAAIIAGLVIFVRHHSDYIKKALDLKPSYIFMLVALVIVGRVLAGLRIKLIVELFDVRLSFMEWFGTAVITNFYNCFLFKGGTALTAVYLKNRHRLNFTRYASLNVGVIVIVMLVSAMTGLACSLYGYIKGAFDLPLVLIFGAMLAGVAVMMLMPKFRFPDVAVLRPFNTLLECWEMMRSRRGTVLKLLVLEAAVLTAFSIRYYIAFRMFSTAVPLYICFILSPFNIISNVLSLIPSGYGVKEALVGAVSKIARTGFTEGVMATMINRVLMMLVAFALAPVFSYFLVGNFNLKVKTDDEICREGA